MSRIGKIGVATAITAGIWMAPRDIEIPQEYLIAKLAQRVLLNMQTLIDAAKNGPSGKTDIAWPLKKIIKDLTRLIKYVIVEPLIALAYLIEKVVRRDFSSATQIAEKNVQELKIQLEVYQKLIDQLEPVVGKVSQLILFSNSITDQLTSEIQQSERITTDVKKQLRLIKNSKNAIDLEKLKCINKTLVDYIQKRLTDTQFLKKLKINFQLFEKVQQQQVDATQKIAKARIQYDTSLEVLSQLMTEYEQLGIDQAEEFQKLKLQYQLLTKENITPYGNSNTITVH